MPILFTPPKVFNEVFPSIVACEKVDANDWSQFKPTSETPLIIGTHSGSFHCDEVVATMLLSLLYGTENVVIIRTRNPDFLNRCQIVVDVGATYVPENCRFDHHQREFVETFGEGYKTKLSSAGLIWKHFGKDILRQIYNVQDQFVDKFYKKFYSIFFEHIDGIDNGIEVAEGELRYKISTTLSSRISYCNPSWKDKNPDYSTYFKKAMEMAFSDFATTAEYFVFEWLDCRKDVLSAFESRFNVDESGEIILFENGCPWKDHLLEIEKENNVEGQVKYVLFQDQLGKWRIQCVPSASGSFESRKPLPEAWRGFRDEALDKILNTEGAIFVHAAGFIGGHNTYEGVLNMARLALKNQ